MVHPDRIDSERPPTYWGLLFDLLKARLGTLLIVVGLAVGVIVYFQFELSVPRRVKLAGFTFVFILPLGYIIGNYIKNLLWEPNYVYLVDLDAAEVDGALYQFPFDHFRNLEVLDGELCQLTTHLYTGKRVDLDEMTAFGTWRGTLSDRELLRSLQKVAECRGTLEDDAKRGFVLETSAFMIISQAARSATLQVVKMFERGSLPDDGEALNAEIDKALERYGLEDKAEKIADSDAGDIEAAAADPVVDPDAASETVPDETEVPADD